MLGSHISIMQFLIIQNMTGNIELKQAPHDFVSNCETIHEETTAIMRQTWPGNNVVLSSIRKPESAKPAWITG
jgi:hypothetical protein